MSVVEYEVFGRLWVRDRLIFFLGKVDFSLAVSLHLLVDLFLLLVLLSPVLFLFMPHDFLLPSPFLPYHLLLPLGLFLGFGFIHTCPCVCLYMCTLQAKICTCTYLSLCVYVCTLQAMICHVAFVFFELGGTLFNIILSRFILFF